MDEESFGATAIANILEKANYINSRINGLMSNQGNTLNERDVWFPNSSHLCSRLYLRNSKQIAILSEELLNSLQGETFGVLRGASKIYQAPRSEGKEKQVSHVPEVIGTSLPSSERSHKKRRFELDVSSSQTIVETSKKSPRICRIPFCQTKAIGKAGLCKKHGGGKRCSTPGCNRASQGRKGKCVSHGGGKRCKHPGCTRLARGKSHLCIPHGGGNRCEIFGCGKLAQGGTKRCIRHGGGKRCKHIETVLVPGKEEVAYIKCTKSAVSSTDFCVAHGGGKRCRHQGCKKGAVGKTNFCVRHGGGKRCQTANCAKSAVGRSGYCISCGGYR